MTEREEKELIKRRASYKGRLTAFANYINTLSDSLSPCQISELQLRLGKIENLYNNYDEIQSKLECLVDDMSAQLSERSEFETLYFTLIAKCQQMLTKYNKEGDDNQSHVSTSNSISNNLVRLPTISLPKFNGSYDTWVEFHDVFSSLIHGQDNIDNINKFHYLRACLEGSAAVVINSIDFSADNYSVAWNILCDRYNNKGLLIQNHVAALFNMDSITRESSVSLKRLMDNVQKNLRALESLGQSVSNWDVLLIHIIFTLN